MINRKKKCVREGDNYSFWEHYHQTIEMSCEGNQEMYKRLNERGDSEKKRVYIIANIPEKYFDFEFDKIIKRILKTEENLDQVKRIQKYLKSVGIASEKGIGLYLSGPHGVAKTTISVIILKRAIELNYRCFFWKSSDIIEFIKSGWKNEYRRVFFDYVINAVDFLVIDDVARLFDLDDRSERLYIDKIFTKRDDMNLSTIITANHALNENREMFGEALFSNFKERLIEVNLIGEDFRNIIGDSLLRQLD